MQNKLTIFDTTLRNGAQAEEISFSIEYKLLKDIEKKFKAFA